MDTLESLNRQSDPLPSSKGTPRSHFRSIRLLYLASFLCLALALGGCRAIAPQIVTTEVTKTADGFTIKSPKDVDAAFFQAGPIIYARYKSSGNAEAIKAGSAEAAQRAASVAKLAEAAAALAH